MQTEAKREKGEGKTERALGFLAPFLGNHGESLSAERTDRSGDR